MAEKKVYSFLQCLEVVPLEDKHDLEIFGQAYKMPKSGMSSLIEQSNSRYKYDFSKKEVVLLCPKGTEIIREKVDPEQFAKSEWKWVRIMKQKAQLELGLDDVYMY